MKRLSCIIFILTIAHLSNAQGCSDAGFCSAGAMHAETIKPSDGFGKNTISITVGISSGENNTSIITPQLEFSHLFSNKSFIEVKLPYYFASGNQGNTSGISDPILTYSNTFYKKANWKYTGIAGLKIGIGNTNKVNENGNALPMPYQAGLGTTDLILGIRADYKEYMSFTAGYQQPLLQYNNNQYSPNAHPLESIAYHSYFESYNLKRKPDVLLRIDGHYQIKKYSFSAGPLFIYHLGEDRAGNTNGEMFEIAGSNGLTLNVTASAQYQIHHFQIGISGGTPLIVRETRPDGLTRSWIVNPKLTYRF